MNNFFLCPREEKIIRNFQRLHYDLNLKYLTFREYHSIDLYPQSSRVDVNYPIIHYSLQDK